MVAEECINEAIVETVEVVVCADVDEAVEGEEVAAVAAVPR